MSEGNKKELQTKLNATAEWLRLKKKTVVAHWLFGALCAGFSAAYFPAGFLMMGFFAHFEKWNDKCDGSHEGAQDWWDGFLIFCVGLTLILILHFCGRMEIRWY